jgi:hypothetical protein
VASCGIPQLHPSLLLSMYKQQKWLLALGHKFLSCKVESLCDYN